MASGIPAGCIAPVRPRVRSPYSGEVVLLEDEIEDLLRQGRRRVVFLEGPPATGKRTALGHLRVRYPREQDLELRTHGEVGHDTVPDGRLLVFAVERRLEWFHREWTGFEMAPWGLDEALEYLQIRHPDAKDDVMCRLVAADDGSHLHGEPLLWSHVLDALVSDPSLGGARAALLRCLETEVSDIEERGALARWALTEIGVLAAEGVEVRPPPGGLSRDGLLVRSQRALYDWLIEEILGDVRAGRLDLVSKIARTLPTFIAELGARVAAEPEVVDRLRLALKYPFAPNPAVLVSLLHVRDDDWLSDVLPVFPGVPRLDLCRAVLPDLRAVRADLRRVRLDAADLGGADLLGADLRGGSCAHANLARADLTGARLDGIAAEGAVLRQASLAQASLQLTALAGADLREADLHAACLDGADLSDADLRDARAAGASLRGARLADAKLAGANLQGADLDRAVLVRTDLHATRLRGASLCSACLARTRLDDVDLQGASMRGADLHEAELTGARLSGADLRGARFTEARMAFADLEGADLRDAHLDRVVFHLGSSRSGLVFSDLASEGTRTGFYTDDDQHLDAKPIEEIRKANLRGANLRGAKVLETDWYLVDLRDARYDVQQREHFRRCGAILEDPTG